MWPFCYVTWPKKGQGLYSFIFAQKSSRPMTYFHETWQVWTLGGPVYIEIVLVDLDLFFTVIDPFSCRNSENKYCHKFVISGPILTKLHRNGLLYDAVFMTQFWWPWPTSSGQTRHRPRNWSIRLRQQTGQSPLFTVMIPVTLWWWNLVIVYDDYTSSYYC